MSLGDVVKRSGEVLSDGLSIALLLLLGLWILSAVRGCL